MASFSFNTQPPEGGWYQIDMAQMVGVVSTHSRPKAAAAGLWENSPFFC